MTPPVLRTSRAPGDYKWPKTLQDLPFSPNSKPGEAVRKALEKAGIDDTTPEISRKTDARSRYQMMDVHRLYTGDDGNPRDRHLHAEVNDGHSVTDHLFRTRDGKTPSVKVNRNKKNGTFKYTDKRIPDGALAGFGSYGLGGAGSGNGPCTCPLCVDATPSAILSPKPSSSCQCPSCLSSSSSSSLGGLGALGLLDKAAAVTPVVRAPQTVEDLMELLRIYKPGKKIVQVAGDLDIVETKVCMLPLEPGVMGPGVMVLCSGGLPDQKAILRDPRLSANWAVGPGGPEHQQLYLKINKTVRIHVHFVLQLAVPNV
ncbi:hypothetical protein JCM3774_005155 [Rhodotorula dairenensis]